MNALSINCKVAALFDPSNLYYFSGYQNADAAIVLSEDKRYYLTDSRCIEEANEMISDFVIVDIGKKTIIEAVISLINDLSAKTVGFESGTISHAYFVELSKHFELVCCQKEILLLRACKNPKEIELIIRAQAITDTVFDRILKFLKPGVTEKAIECKINSMIYEMGGSLAFDTIVAFGKNTSKPHAHPSEMKLEKNDIILLDYGAKYNGYCSDMSRSLAIGSVSREYKERYQTVLEAQNIAINNMKVGLTGMECDALARDYFKIRGLDGNFTHSLGHSLGIDIHEEPRLSKTFKGMIPKNAVMSVEPGLYFEKENGIRIEDIVVFKENGVDNLTNSPKKLIIL